MYNTAARIPSVHRGNPTENFTRFSNDTIRDKYPGISWSDRCAVKEIFNNALTCSNEVIFTTESIAEYHGIAVRTAFKYLSILRRYGRVRHITDRCNKTGRILSHRWVFFEHDQTVKPQCKIVHSGSPEPKSPKSNEKKAENPQCKIVQSGTLYKERTYREKTNNPPVAAKPDPETPPKRSLLELRNKIRDEIRNKIEIGHIKKLLKKYSPGQVRTHIERMNNIDGLRDPAGYFIKPFYAGWQIEDYDETHKAVVVDRKSEVEKVEKIRQERQEFLQTANYYDKIKREYLAVTPGKQRELFREYLDSLENPVLRRIASKKNRVNIIDQMSFQRWLDKKRTVSADGSIRKHSTEIQ